MGGYALGWTQAVGRLGATFAQIVNGLGDRVLAKEDIGMVQKGDEEDERDDKSAKVSKNHLRESKSE